VLLLFRCVLGELVGDRVGVETRGREVVLVVPQDAHDLGGEGLVADADHPFHVRAVGGCHRALLHLGTCPVAQGLDVGEEVGH
jgi:hypothetical protein